MLIWSSCCSLAIDRFIWELTFPLNLEELFLLAIYLFFFLSKMTPWVRPVTPTFENSTFMNPLFPYLGCCLVSRVVSQPWDIAFSIILSLKSGLFSSRSCFFSSSGVISSSLVMFRLKSMVSILLWLRWLGMLFPKNFELGRFPRSILLGEDTGESLSLSSVIILIFSLSILFSSTIVLNPFPSFRRFLSS